jgi:outer membrane immunogenic protein
MKRLLLAAAAIAASVSPVFSADMVQPAAVVHNWTGAYVGGVVGYGWGTTHALDNNSPSTGIGYDGFLGGVELGYNYQFSNNVVLGAETDFSFSDLGGQGDGGPGWGCGTPDTCTFDVKWFGTARARVGYAFGNVMPYLTGGLAYGHTKGNLASYCPGTAWCGDDTKFGWTAGAGAEWAINDRWSIKAEYLYVDLGKSHFGTGNGGDGFEAQFRVNTARLGVNYKF